jgi:hypothetical protein
MKHLLACLLLFGASYGFSQTAVISSKNHSGDLSFLLEENDNFGDIEPPRSIDSVVKIDKSCIVEIGTRWGDVHYHDTICEHWALEQRGYTETVVKDLYGNKVEVIGFGEISKGTSVKPGGGRRFWNRRQSKNGFSLWIAAILLSILAYSISPIFRKK